MTAIRPTSCSLVDRSRPSAMPGRSPRPTARRQSTGGTLRSTRPATTARTMHGRQHAHPRCDQQVQRRHPFRRRGRQPRDERQHLQRHHHVERPHASVGYCSGVATFAGTTTWTGADMNGTFTIPAGSTFNLIDPGFHAINGGSLTNNGALKFRASVTSSSTPPSQQQRSDVERRNREHQCRSGATLTNGVTGTFNLNASLGNTGVFGSGTFQNNGTVNSTGPHICSHAVQQRGHRERRWRKTRFAGGGTDTGAYVVDAGATLAFANGTRDAQRRARA